MASLSVQTGMSAIMVLNASSEGIIVAPCLKLKLVTTYHNHVMHVVCQKRHYASELELGHDKQYLNHFKDIFVYRYTVVTVGIRLHRLLL